MISKSHLPHIWVCTMESWNSLGWKRQELWVQPLHGGWGMGLSRLWVDLCSHVGLHGLQWNSCLTMGCLHHGLQGNRCSNIWSTSSAFLTLLSAGLFHSCYVLTSVFVSSCFSAVTSFPFLNALSQRCIIFLGYNIHH